MFATLKLAWKSLNNRRLTSGLTVVSIGLSVTLLLGVERIRVGAWESFSNTISQTDLIVGAKGGTIQLLLYTVFRLGSPTANISYKTYEKWQKHPAVSWTIPYSLGDSHRGFRVVGTDENFYKHYHYHMDQEIHLGQGKQPVSMFDVALGSDVAEKLNYQLGQKIVLAHGVTEGPAIESHEDKPFTVVGILNRTGTPIDRSLYVTLEGMEAIHIDWTDGAPPMKGREAKASELEKRQLPIGQITSFLLRTKSRLETLSLQREINTYEAEPLMAIIPGVSLAELWNSIGYAETALQAVSIFVVIIGFLSMFIALYSSINERRREMSILRAVGAKSSVIIFLLVFEAILQIGRAHV